MSCVVCMRGVCDVPRVCVCVVCGVCIARRMHVGYDVCCVYCACDVSGV